MSIHGGLRATEVEQLGLATANVVDFSVNLNPYGPAPGLLDALRSVDVTAYPDPESLRARAALAQWLGLPSERISLGNGASELLWTITSCLVSSSTEHPTAVIATPLFGEVEAACVALGVTVRSVPSLPQRGFAPNFEALKVTVRGCDKAFAVLSHPGTPTGAALPWDELVAFCEGFPQLPIVLDESFLSLSKAHARAQQPLPYNVIRVRSLTKDLAIPGVRIGYALTTPELARAIERHRPAWSVGAAAQLAAELSPRYGDFVAQSRERLTRDRDALVSELETLGLEPFESIAPYVAFRCENAARLRHRLLSRHGVATRDCASFGLPDVLRVAARPADERARLLDALRAECRQGGWSMAPYPEPASEPEAGR